MLKELSKVEFGKCRDLINPDGQLEVKAVIERMNPGRIFVDDRDLPTSGLIWLGSNNGFFFIGDENNETFNRYINEFIEKVVVPKAGEVNLDWFEAIGNHDDWDKTIENVLSQRNLGSWKQRVYTLQSSDYRSANEPLLEEGYKVVKVTENLLSFNPQLNSELLQEKIGEFWYSKEEFFDKGIGYCVMDENEIVSTCLSGFVVDDVHCIDIETKENHQGKKLAQSVAHHFVRECLDHQMLPYWDCMEKNEPSVAVAEKLGFENVFNYVGYDFPLK